MHMHHGSSMECAYGRVTAMEEANASEKSIRCQ